MKRIFKTFIIIFMFIPFVVNAATDVITNTKLHKAIMDYDGIFIDTNSDGVLSSSEVANYNGNLNLSNKNLTSSDINELSKFKNLTHLSLDFNNITDLSSILGLSKLSYLSLSGNPYNCSFINGFDKCNQLYELKSMIESNSGNIATLGLKINFDTSKITASTPKYKVLVTIVKDINTDVTFLNGGTGHVEYHMNDLDITLIKEYMRLFEMYVEKLSNYKVDLLVDYYITKNTVTSLIPNGTSADGEESQLFPSNISEINNIISDYDTGIVVAYTHHNTHTFSGVAGFKGDDGAINKNRGEVFIPYDQNMYVFMLDSYQYISLEEKNKLFTDLGTTEAQLNEDVNDYSKNAGDTINSIVNKLRNTAIKKSMEAKIAEYKKNLVNGAELDTFVHEFIHTLEMYNSIRGYKTWEFHDALRFGQEYPGIKMNVSDTYDYEGLYLNGYSKPEDETEKGINEEVYNNPPTKYYTTTLGNISAPTLQISVNEEDERITLNWNTISGVTQYKVLKSTDSNKINEIVYFTDGTTYKDTNIKVGTKYYYKVVAIKSSGIECVRSDDSNIVNGLIPFKTVEEKPLLSISSSNNKVTLNWNKVDNARSYIIKRSTSKTGSFSTIKSGDINTFTDTGLTYGKTYYYKVIAKNDLSSKESDVIGKKIVPNKVSGLKLKAVNKAITISWNKVSGNGYELYYSLNGTKWTKLKTITSANTLTFKHSKLSINKMYYYKVRAYKTVSGNKVFGSYSEMVSTKTAPKKTSVKIYSKGYNKILLNITKVAGASKYNIYRSTSKTKGFKKIATSTTTAYNDITVLPTVTYYYKVKACNIYNACGDYSNVVSKKTSLKTISDLKKTLGNLKVNLTFSTIPGATSYQIYRSTSKTGKYTKIGTANENNYSDTKVKANKTYYYKVRSYLSKDGKNYYSAFSNIVSAKAKEME